MTILEASTVTAQQAAPRTALLFTTHFFDRWAARRFAALRRRLPPHFEPFVLMHVPPGTPKPARLRDVPHHFVTTPEIRDPAYPRKSSEQDWTGRPWSLWGGGHCDLIVLHFYRARPEYDRYWVVEYDVAFSGDWRRFFDAFEASDADLLSIALRRRRDDPFWVIWPSLLGPDAPEEVERHSVGAFLPIFRASRRAVGAIDAAYRAGWTGHIEGSWPTICDLRGLKLEDIGGHGEFVAPENRGRFYANTRSTLPSFYLAPGTFFARPVLHRVGSRRDTLWHPVKPFRLTSELREALREYRIIAGAKRRELQAWLAARRGSRQAASAAE